jgi:hypothetical protein
MRLLLATIAICTYCAWFSAKCEAKDNPQMIELQCAGDMFHASTICVSDLGVRLKSKSATTLWLVKDAKTGVVINSESGVYLIQPIDEWVHYYQRDYSHPSLQTTRSTEFPLTAEKNAIKTLVYSGEPEQLVGEIVSLKEPKFAPPVMAFWCNLMMSKPELGFPIALKVFGKDHSFHRRHLGHAGKFVERNQSMWKTLVEFKSVRSVPLDRSLFTVPKTYKRTYDVAALFFSEDGVLKPADLDDMFRVPVK